MSSLAILRNVHAEVGEKWHEFSEPFEGRVHSMYVDVKGLVTTGVGNLIDTAAGALQLPWRLVTDAAQLKATDEDPLASASEIAAAWSGLKQQRDKFAKLHWKYAAKLNRMRLTDLAVDTLVQRVLQININYLARTFPKWASFPADAQLGILSMAWALGPGFTTQFGNFRVAALAGDWTAAVAACKIREAGNPGVVPRNAANRLCFSNAALVAKGGYDVDRVFWPNVVPPGGSARELLVEAKEAIDAKAVFDSAIKKWTESEYERVRDAMQGGAAAMASDEDGQA